MRKRIIVELATLAEIISSIAVVISLVFVVHSIQANTKEVRNARTNYLNAGFVEIMKAASEDQELAAKLANTKFGIEFPDGSTAQFFWLQRREFDLWETAYYYHSQGDVTEEIWDLWNDYYLAYLPSTFPEEWWKAIRHGFLPQFALLVDSAYERDRLK